MNRHLLARIAGLILLVLAVRPAPGSPSKPVAVLGVSGRDVADLEAQMEAAAAREIEGIRFVSGRVEGQPVVIAWTGVGKVNVAMVTTLLIEHFRPERLIFTGIAGAVDPNLEPGDLVIARQTAYHDMGSYWSGSIEPGGVRDRLTGETNPVFFPADPNLLAAAQRAARGTAFDPIEHRNGQRPPKVVVGTVVTGDTFIASSEKCEELAEQFEAAAVEMEAAAAAQLCYQRGIACLVVRSIADKADESAVVDKQKFYLLAAGNSTKLVARILRSLRP